jgi:hypothetical protein
VPHQSHPFRRLAWTLSCLRALLQLQLLQRLLRPLLCASTWPPAALAFPRNRPRTPGHDMTLAHPQPSRRPAEVSLPKHARPKHGVNAPALLAGNQSHPAATAVADTAMLSSQRREHGLRCAPDCPIRARHASTCWCLWQSLPRQGSAKEPHPGRRHVRYDSLGPSPLSSSSSSTPLPKRLPFPISVCPLMHGPVPRQSHTLYHHAA